MDRIDKILNHNLFLDCMEKNNEAEAERRFCRHNVEHFLDVARIGCIINLEESLGLEKEMIYAAALLHDIGRYLQYKDGTPHEEASVRIAPEILRDCGFDEKETSDILSAIASHRDKKTATEKNLKGVLYRADKASRICFACRAEGCNRTQDRRNLRILY